MEAVGRRLKYEPTISLLPTNLEPLKGDPLAALFSGRRLWVMTTSSYYSVQFHPESQRVTLIQYSASSRLHIRDSAWQWVAGDVIDLLTRFPVFTVPEDA
jgi:hypothetical protein